MFSFFFTSKYTRNKSYIKSCLFCYPNLTLNSNDSNAFTLTKQFTGDAFSITLEVNTLQTRLTLENWLLIYVPIRVFNKSVSSIDTFQQHFTFKMNNCICYKIFQL